MRNKAILFSVILIASNSVLAGQSLLEGVAKQTAKEKATEVAPGAVNKAQDANQAIDRAKTLKEGAENTPDALTGQAKEAVKEKIDAAAPEEAKKAGETLKSGKETAENLNGKVNSVPKTTKAINNKAKQKATEKTLDLMH